MASAAAVRDLSDGPPGDWNPMRDDVERITEKIDRVNEQLFSVRSWQAAKDDAISRFLESDWKSVLDRHADHESRIRALEKAWWKFAAQVGLVAAAVAVVLQEVIRRWGR